MGVCVFPPSWMWAFSIVGAVFSILTASTLVFRHRQLRFTATVTLIFGVAILVATLLGPIFLLTRMGDTGGIDDIASASIRWGAFRRCFAEGGIGAVIPLFIGSLGVIVDRVARLRSEPPPSIPPVLPPS
ncbi:MAG: hypothetical protein JWM74_3434 [Myxococcaceae bacterium]|nr:hypothetical protein [Myxococcaceae bacterium]